MDRTTGLAFLSPLLLPLALASCMADQPVSAASEPPPAPSAAPSPAIQPPIASGTAVLDAAAAERLLGASGITLQWIGWDRPGPVDARRIGNEIRVTGSQREYEGPGRLFVEGTVREIGEDYFILDGTIRIADTPERGRMCEADKLWRFAITQNRKYWRLREFEWCDGLTDYVDIYF